jgi:peroxiredoxin
MKIRGVLRMIGERLTGREFWMPKPGDAAPDFEVKNHRGETVRLSDYRGRNVVLWFYPMADTPG